MKRKKWGLVIYMACGIAISYLVRVNIWIEWALKKADWYDPSIATEDEYLGKRQHEKSAEEKEKSLQDSIRKSWYW